jgi:hypothetical protein
MQPHPASQQHVVDAKVMTQISAAEFWLVFSARVHGNHILSSDIRSVSTAIDINRITLRRKFRKFVTLALFGFNI